MAMLDYVELPAGALATSTDFYARAFGWNFTAYGGQYAAYEEPPCQLGLDAGDDRIAVPLPVIRVDSLEEARAAVLAAGGAIGAEPFAYPGGRRFHFTDPAGNQLACYRPDD